MGGRPVHAIRMVLILAVIMVQLVSCASVEERDPPPSSSVPTRREPSAEPPGRAVDRAEREAAIAERVLSQMSLEQIIGQRFVTWLDGTGVTPVERRLVVEGLVGGFIVYPANVESRAQITELTSDLQRFADSANPPVGLFLASDQEGGRVSAVRLSDMPSFPASSEWARHEDTAYIEAASYVVNRELEALGFNMNFAPVLDVSERADDGIIGDRAFGDDPELVGRFGPAYLRGARRAGIIPVPKHFPGHGTTTVDSHGTLPVVDISLDELFETHVLPFREVVDYGAEAIMTAHLLLPPLDDEHPATLSRPIIDGLLREEMGFRGVVISDGFAMGAISQNYGVEEAIELSIDAGVDIILTHARYDVAELIETTVDLVESGRVSHSSLVAGTRRILELKVRHGLLGTSSTDR
ncbi:MAG: glycoside hydrolase family 3 N-terminal domain-containing protein [Spirochaetia bacterium]